MEPSIVEADGRRPDPAAMQRRFETLDRVFIDRMSDDRPIDQVLGPQHRQARETTEAGSGQVKIIPDADDIGVGIVGENDGVFVSSIAVIRRPRAKAFPATLLCQQNTRPQSNCQYPQQDEGVKMRLGMIHHESNSPG